MSLIILIRACTLNSKYMYIETILSVYVLDQKAGRVPTLSSLISMSPMVPTHIEATLFILIFTSQKTPTDANAATGMTDHKMGE